MVEHDAAADPVRAVEEILSAIRGTAVAELEVELGDLRIRVTRDPDEGFEPLVHPGSEGDTKDPRIVIRSGYVGVFHREPGRYPGLGKEVSAGTALGEIETLQIRNTVTAPVDGTVVEILLQDQSPVEYGQPLIAVMPHHDAARSELIEAGGG